MANIIPSTLSPTLGTPIQNTSGYDEIVFVIGQSPNDNLGARTITALCDAASTPATQVASNLTVSKHPAVALVTYATVAFVVPNGYYWKITGTIASVTGAWAWQLQVTGASIIRDVTGSRSLATTYQNTTGNAVLLLPQINNAVPNIFSILHDSFSPPTSIVWKQSPKDIGVFTPWALIPNGDYYQVTCTGATITKWLEVQLPLQATRTDVTASRAVQTIFQNTSTESVFEVPIITTPIGVVGNRYRHLLNIDTVTPPVQVETSTSDTNSGEFETLAGLVGVNYYFRENSPDAGGTNDNLSKWWKYVFVPSPPALVLLQCAQP